MLVTVKWFLLIYRSEDFSLKIISFSNNCQLISNFDSGKKQSVAQINDYAPLKLITDEEYHNFKSYPSTPQKFYVASNKCLPPQTIKYIKIRNDARRSPFATKVEKCLKDKSP